MACPSSHTTTSACDSPSSIRKLRRSPHQNAGRVRLAASCSHISHALIPQTCALPPLRSSQTTLDFTNSLLTYDPAKRLSASSALAHRWLSPSDYPVPSRQVKSVAALARDRLRSGSSRRSSFGGGGMAGGGAAGGMAGSGGRGKPSGGELGLEMSGGDGYLGGSRGLKRPHADSLASAASAESNGEGRRGPSSGPVEPPMAVAAAAHPDLSGVARIPSPDDVITTTARQC